MKQGIKDALIKVDLDQIPEALVEICEYGENGALSEEEAMSLEPLIKWCMLFCEDTTRDTVVNKQDPLVYHLKDRIGHLRESLPEDHGFEDDLDHLYFGLTQDTMEVIDSSEVLKIMYDMWKLVYDSEYAYGILKDMVILNKDNMGLSWGEKKTLKDCIHEIAGE